MACLTPPPETLPPTEEEPLAVQDASNQTDTPICSEDDNTIHTLPEVAAEVKSNKPPPIQETVVEESTSKEVEVADPETSEATPKPVEEPEEVQLPESTQMEVEDTRQNVEVEKPQQEPAQPPKPDISGLELLSNSIVEFENCRKSAEQISVKQETEPKVREQGDEVLKGIAHMTLKDTENDTVIVKNVDDSLGGLNLLCALAEQRIMEEVDEKNKSRNESKSKDLEKRERKKEKRKSKKHHDEQRRKKLKVSDENKFYNGEDKIQSQEKQPEPETKCSCTEENYRAFRTPQSAEEVRKFIASKSQNTCCKGEWPCMNAMELDMRMRLADLQRQYREKQKELSKLKPKKHSSDCSKKKSRKKSTHSDRSATPPPLLDKMDVPVKPNKNIPDLLKPPTLCAETIKLPKLEPAKHTTIKTSNESPHKRYDSPGPELSDSTTPEKRSSSKKRKVGRPKKLLSSSGLHIPTETIVAKKPKKGSLVGYLLAAKEKLKMQSKNGFMYSDSPPRYVEEPTKVKYKSHKNKNNNNIIEKSYMEMENSCKIRPKLKAEPKIKVYNEEDDIKNESDIEADNEEEEEEDDGIQMDEVMEEEEEEEEETKDNIKMEPEPEPEPQPEPEKVVEEPAKPVDTRCILTAEHLEVDKLRVLTAMGGLFYAGRLNAVEPPDVYSITLDGERGNRPHIMSREEILRDAVSLLLNFYLNVCL